MVYSLHAVRLFCYVLISCCVDIWEGPPAEYVRAVFRHGKGCKDLFPLGMRVLLHVKPLWGGLGFRDEHKPSPWSHRNWQGGCHKLPGLGCGLRHGSTILPGLQWVPGLCSDQIKYYTGWMYSEGLA